MRSAWIAGCVSALALTIGAPAAMAEAPAVERTDPNSESPAGVIYQIPLDSARRDAAPVLPTGRRDNTRSTAGGAGSSGGGTGGSSGSSGSGDLGGSSSGNASARHGAGAGPSASSATASAGADGGTPQDPSSIHSENGFGSASQVPGVSQAALRTGAGVAATQAAASTMPTYLLIALIAVAAIVMGLLATRHSRRRDV
jgi:hypothetical protein